MHPGALLSYYPTYSLLDEIVSYKNYKKINFFIDLKNCLQSTYMSHVVTNLTEITKKSGKIDTSILSSFLSFISFHKLYSIKRQLDIEINFFYDFGESFYHKNIDKNYKSSRKINTLPGLDLETKELFSKILESNLKLINSVGNKLPNTNIIMLEHLETDFIPYYIIRNNLIDSKDSCNIIYSNDHDMFQCVELDDTYIYRKIKKEKYIIKKNNILSTYLKNKENKLQDKYYPLIMAMLGDKGDDVKKLVKNTEKTINFLFNDVIKFLDFDTIFNDVYNNNDIFKEDIKYYEDNCNLKETIKLIENEKNYKSLSNNLKLVSFELLSMFLDNPKTTEALSHKNKIHDIFKNKKIININNIKQALDKLNILLENDEIDIIYYEKQNIIEI